MSKIEVLSLKPHFLLVYTAVLNKKLHISICFPVIEKGIQQTFTLRSSTIKSGGEGGPSPTLVTGPKIWNYVRATFTLRGSKLSRGGWGRCPFSYRPKDVTGPMIWNYIKAKLPLSG